METIKTVVEEEVPKEKEPPLKKVFVEVGTWEMPVPFLGKRKFGEDEIYVGIDVNKKSIHGAKRRSRVGVGEARNPIFVQADAMQLPMADSSAEEIYFGNVLGDPSISEESKTKFLEEATRILKAGGRLVIKENNTPLPQDELQKLLEGKGLEPVKFLKPKDKDWEKEIAPYHSIAGQTENWWNTYLAILKKAEEKKER